MPAKKPSWIFPLAPLIIVNLATAFVVYRTLINDSNFERVATEKILWDARAKGEQESPVMVGQRIEELRRERRIWYLLPLFRFH